MDSDAGLVTGEYFLNHQLVTYQSQGQNIGIDLQYSSAQADPTPVVQYQFTTPVAGDSSSITSINAQVSLAGVVQGDATTYNTPDGLTDGETYDIPLQVDASELPTGVYTYTMTVTENFGSEDDRRRVTTTDQGSVNVVNESSDPLGAGWSVGGLQQLSQLATDGPVLITAGQQGTEAFQPAYTEGQTYVQDLALATTLGRRRSWPMTARATSRRRVSASDTVVGTAAGDFNSDGEPDLAVVTSSTLAIELNNGSGGFTAGDSYTIPSGYEAKGVVVGNFTGHDNSDLDIAVLLASTSTDAYSVAVYTGTGDGTLRHAGDLGGRQRRRRRAPQPDSIVAADFNGDGKTDVAFITDDGLLDVMLATSGGSMSSATSLTLPSGHLAVGVTTLDYNDDGDTDLVVEAKNTNVEEGGDPFVSLDLFDRRRLGRFQRYRRPTRRSASRRRRDRAGRRRLPGLEHGPRGRRARRSGDGDATTSTSSRSRPPATWGTGVIHYCWPMTAERRHATGQHRGRRPQRVGQAEHRPDRRHGQDLGPARRPRQQPVPAGRGHQRRVDRRRDRHAGRGALHGHRRDRGLPRPHQRPSTLVQNEDGSWTRTYPDGTVIQFNSSGQETSETDRNGNTFTYAYVASGAAAGAWPRSPTPWGWSRRWPITIWLYQYDHRPRRARHDLHGRRPRQPDRDRRPRRRDHRVRLLRRPRTTRPRPRPTPTAIRRRPHYNSFGQLTSETLFDGTSTTVDRPGAEQRPPGPGRQRLAVDRLRGKRHRPRRPTPPR